MKILILDGNENQAVACVRSLGRAGHEVSVGADTSWSKAGWSKYSQSSFQYPSPQTNIDGFIQSIVSEVKKADGTLVLPMTECSTLPISEYRDLILSAGGRLFLPSHKDLLRAFDKNQTTYLAEQLGISVPKTLYLDSLDAAREAAKSISYPVVLKPRSSNETVLNSGVLSTGRPLYANSASEFINAFTNIHSRSSVVLAQEFIEGTGSGFFALVSNGEILAEFSHRRLRDVHPTGSGSSLRESTIQEFKIRNKSIQLLQELKWQGVAMVEFRLRPDGEPVFLEVNGRFWNSLSLAIYAGVDFPRLLVEVVEKGVPETKIAFKPGVRCRWLLGDFRHLLAVMKGRPIGFLGAFPDRFQTILDFFTPVRGTYHDNFTLDDPLPELGDWVDFFFRKIPRKLKKNVPDKGLSNVKERYSHS